MKYYNKSIKALSLFGNLGAISIAVFGLLSYIPGFGLLGSIRDDYIPMAPSTAVSFIVLGYCMYTMSMSAISNLKSSIILSATVLISLFGLLELIGFYYGVDLNFEDNIVPAAGQLNNIPIGRMSPSTGTAFFFAGTAILLLILQHRLPKYKKNLKHTGGVFAVIIIFTGFTFCLSYLYGTPLLYSEGTTIPMALTTSLAFLLLGFGIIGLAGESAFPNCYLVGHTISNYLFRYILPLCVLAVVMGGCIVIYASHIVQMNPALAAASLTAIMIFIAGIFAILISKHMGNTINKAEDAIKKSESMKSKMVANIGDVIVIIDKAGITRYKSPNVEKLFGWKPEELIGISAFENVHPEDLRFTQVFFKNIMQRPNAVGTIECRFKHKNGNYKFISFTGSNLLHDPDIQGILGNYCDISKRKLNETELVKAKELAEENEILLKKSESAVSKKLKAIMEPTGNLDSLSLSDIIDTEVLQAMMDDFYKITNMSSAIGDPSGKVLASVGWQDICMKFHRVNPKTQQNCHESDTILTTGVEKGTFKAYRCKNNMWDMATPIEVNGRIVGNIYIGQFFYDDETPDLELFRNQAKLYGFNEEEYLTALESVPRFSKEKIESAMLFISKLAGMISNLSYRTIRLAGSINELKQAGKIITESEKKFKAIFEQAGGYCMILDPNTPDGIPIIIDANQAACSIHGYTREEFIGRPVSDIDDDDGKRMAKKRTGEIMSGKPFYCENIHIRQDGTRFPVSVNAQRIDIEDQPSFILSIEYDISKRKHYETELIKAKELAEENNHLKSAFLRNMSHEIRTPMNGIMGFSNLMLEAEGNKKNEYAMIVQKSSEQLLALIDDVLLISRLQSEKTSIKNVEFSPAELIMDISRVFSLDNINDNLDIIINIPKQYKDLIILADVGKIKQIITNFSSNAVKYTSKGNIELGFDIKNKDIEFYVKDTGMGIPKQEQELIFDNFHRGDEAISRAIRGSGLGLCIANELVKTLNGKIGVSSEPKHGSRFHLTIPLKKIKKEYNKEVLPQTKQNKLKELNILVAEDELINYQYIEIILNGIVKKIDRAMNGKEAVELASKNCYDLILMDLKMPIMDGFLSTQKIKQQFPDLPIIAHTAYVRSEDKERALESGCDDFIGKPFNKDDLLKIIDRLMTSKLKNPRVAQ